MRAVTAAVGLSGSLFAIAPGAAGAADCEPPVVTFKCPGESCTLDLTFPNAIPKLQPCRVRIDDAFVSKHEARRITEDTALTVTVHGINYLRYGLKYEVSEKVIESYVFLERLWKQIFGLAAFGADRTRVAAAFTDEFGTRLLEWRDGLDAADAALTEFIRPFDAVVLNPDEAAAIKSKRKQFGELVEGLRARMTSANNAIDPTKLGEQLPVYERTLATHREVLGRFTAFEEAAGLVENGHTRRVRFGDAGRIVSVSITPVEESTGKEYGRELTVEFLVHSTLPLTFHVGYAVSSLDKIDFEAVSAAARSDLFAKIQSDGMDQDVVALMSWSPWKNPFHVAFGTAFSKPGEKLYAGLGWKWNRFVVTVGGMNAATQEEESNSKVVETIAGVAGSVPRDLYASFKNRRAWEFFGAFSVSPF